MKSAILIGYHGHKNFGDDIFRQILMKWLALKFDVGACSVTAEKGSIEESIFGVKLSTIEIPFKRISRSLWLPVFFKALKSNYLIFSAGSIFTIQPFFIIYVMLRVLKLIKGKSLKIMAIGISIGPFKNNFDRYWCLKLFELMDCIITRDEKSSLMLNDPKHNVKYKLSYDLALSWYEFFPQGALRENREPNLIGIAMTSRGFKLCKQIEHSDDCNVLLDSFTQLKEMDIVTKVRVYSICDDKTNGDYELSLHIVDRISSLGFSVEIVSYEGTDIEGYLASINECTIMIAARMHAGIMATYNGVPVYQISYAEKISNFYDHTGLLPTHMYTLGHVNSENLVDFMTQGLSSKLQGFSDEHSRKLKQKGKMIYDDLMSCEI